MQKRFKQFVVGLVLFAAGAAFAQYALVDMIAKNVVEKYSSATCEQLWEARGKPKTAEQQQFIQMLRNDGGMRTEFWNRIAGPVANKMFECGLIP